MTEVELSNQSSNAYLLIWLCGMIAHSAPFSYLFGALGWNEPDNSAPPFEIRLLGAIMLWPLMDLVFLLMLLGFLANMIADAGKRKWRK